jgi:hypothetical protein
MSDVNPLFQPIAPAIDASPHGQCEASNRSEPWLAVVGEREGLWSAQAKDCNLDDFESTEFE